jgi:RNA polymerase sigma factor (sigma-70 family)
MSELDRIIERYGPGLARLAASYEADVALREDLLQEILFAIHRALPGLREHERLGPFVFRIAHNRAVTHIIQRRGEKRQPPPDPDIPDTTPEQRYLAEERSRRLMAAVRRLPLAYRQVVTMVLEEFSYAEIAEALDLSVSNVAVRVNRAKTMLKEMLNEE